MQAAPLLNSSVEGDSVIYHSDINIGVAVALDWGLIVPVVKHADSQDLPGISRQIADLAARARAKQLTPDDVSGGTFTITNPGMLGAQFGMPIINQPQTAILAVALSKDARLSWPTPSPSRRWRIWRSVSITESSTAPSRTRSCPA